MVATLQGYRVCSLEDPQHAEMDETGVANVNSSCAISYYECLLENIRRTREDANCQKPGCVFFYVSNTCNILNRKKKG